MVLADGGEGGGGGGGEGGGGGSAADRAAAEAYAAQRQAAMDAAVAADVAAALEAAADDAAPILRLRVSAVEPLGRRPPGGGGYGGYGCGGGDDAPRPLRHAMLKFWRPTEDDTAALREGSVFAATCLSPCNGENNGAPPLAVGGAPPPAPDGSGPPPERLLDLQTTRQTRLRRLGDAEALAGGLRLSREPRVACTLATLCPALFHREFEFEGWLLHAGPPASSGGAATSQWLFLADPGVSDAAAGGGNDGGGGNGDAWGRGGGGGGGGGWPAAGPLPRLLAVQVVTTRQSVDFLDPSRDARGPVALRDAILLREDAANGLWVAVAPDTAAVAPMRGVRAAAAAAPLARWAAANGPLIAALTARVAALAG